MTERERLILFKTARQKRDEAREALKAAQEEYEKIETEMIEHLISAGADSTAKYDDIGYAQLMKPRVYANCLKENEDKLKDYLREKRREDIIKESVSPQALSSYIGELIDGGKAIPDFISYYLKQSVKLC